LLPVAGDDPSASFSSHALEATGGGCSLLFEHNRAAAALHATVGYGLDELRVDPVARAEEAALLAQTFSGTEPMLVTDLARQMPDLAPRLGTAKRAPDSARAGPGPPWPARDRFSLAPNMAEIGLESLATAGRLRHRDRAARLRRRDDLLRDLPRTHR